MKRWIWVFIGFVVILICIIVCIFEIQGFSWKTSVNNLMNESSSVITYYVSEDSDSYINNDYKQDLIFQSMTKVGNPQIRIRPRNNASRCYIDWHIEKGYFYGEDRDISSGREDYEYCFYMYDCTVHISNADIKFIYFTDHCIKGYNDMRMYIQSFLSSEMVHT